MSNDAGAVVSAFGCHLVAIALRYRKLSEVEHKNSHLAAFSATIIDLDGVLYLLTAGHVVERINEAYASDQIVIEGCGLVDNFGYEARHNQMVPFPWDPARAFSINEEGADVGLVRLDANVVRNLLENRLLPISESNWRHQHRVQFDAYFLLGLPREAQPLRTTSGGAFFNAAAVPLIKVERPDFVADTGHPEFFAKVRDDATVRDVDGMSGGPIVGVRIENKAREPAIRYWIVAIQSAWFPQTRIIRATPVYYFADQILEGLRAPSSH